MSESFAKLRDEMLSRYERRYKAGDAEALLEALRWCFGMDTPPPDWVRVRVNEALMRYWMFEAVTLDAAFGVKRSKDKRTLEHGRERVTHVEKVTFAVLKAHRRGSSLNDALFQRIGTRLGLSRSRVIEYWNEGKRLFGPLVERKRPSRRRRSL